MAKLLKGKYKNRKCTILKWYNHHLSVKGRGFTTNVVISDVQFEPDEFRSILFHEDNDLLLKFYEPNYHKLTFVRRQDV